MADTVKNNFVERLLTREERSRAVVQVVEEAVRRHKEMGKSIAVWEEGRVVIVPAEEIVLLEDTQRKTEPAVRELAVRELAQSSAG